MVSETDVLFSQTQVQKPVLAEVLPVVEPLKVCVRLAEELKLHLLKLSCSESEVSRSDFVSERLTNLSNTEWDFLSCCSCDVCKVYENTLSCFRSQVKLVFSVFCNTLESFEHKVKLSDVCKVCAAAVRACDFVFFDEISHLLQSHAVWICAEVLDELVSTVTGFAVLTVHERVRETAYVTGSYPCLRIHKDS